MIMNVRSFLAISVASAVSLAAMTGCDDGPSAPVPPELGDIAVSQDKIGIGHQIVFTVEDQTSVSGNVYSLDPVWTINGNEIMDIYTSYDFVNGRGRYTCYYVPMNAGIMEVALNVDMRFNDAPAGEEEKSVSVSGEFEVVRCDARNSFWGDSVDITMYREPGLVKRGSSDEYIGEGTSSIMGLSSMISSVDLTYVFENGGLVQIVEEFLVSADRTDGYEYVADVFDFALRTLETEYVGGSISGRTVQQLDTDRTECLAVANKYKRGETLTSEEMSLLGEGMVKGWISIVSSMTFENTDIRFASEALPTSSSANMALTYSER